MTWTCPHCERPFSRKRAHVCAPGLPLAYWLDEQPEAQRRAAERVLAIARGIEGLVVEAVSVGVFIKRERSIVELRPRAKWLQLSFVIAATIDSPRITRTWKGPAFNVYYVRLHDETDVDRQVRAWITRALRAPRVHSAP